MGKLVMTKSQIFFFIIMVCLFISMILFVFFGEYTVRKLRKLNDTKDDLGFDPVGGKDIFNVAVALTIPRNWNRKLRSTPLGDYFADADKILPHTKLFDRIVARMLGGLFIFITIGLLTLILIDQFTS